MKTPSVFGVTDYWFPKIGGMERSIENLCLCLCGDFKVALLTGGEPGEDASTFPFQVSTLPIEGDAGYYGAALKRIRAAIGPRIVHLFGFSYRWPHAQAELVRRLARLPDTAIVVKTPTSGDARRYLSTSHAATAGSIHCYIALTTAIEQELRECGIPRERICRLPNGVRTDWFLPVDDEHRRGARLHFGLPLDRPVVGFCGRFERRKRIDLLAAALAL